MLAQEFTQLNSPASPRTFTPTGLRDMTTRGAGDSDEVD